MNKPYPKRPEIGGGGSSTNHGNSALPFFDPSKQLVVTKSPQQLQQDAEEVKKYFSSQPTVVPRDVQQSIKEAILVKRGRSDGELFTAMRRIDNPEAKSEVCGKKLRCGHLCEEPRIIQHECGVLCSAIKNVVRTCGHTTQIFCSRTETLTRCREKCGKVVECRHNCRKECHFSSECPQFCNDYHCQIILNAKMAAMGNSNEQIN